MVSIPYFISRVPTAIIATNDTSDSPVPSQLKIYYIDNKPITTSILFFPDPPSAANYL